jgi:hypothetical protein
MGWQEQKGDDCIEQERDGQNREREAECDPENVAEEIGRGGEWIVWIGKERAQQNAENKPGGNGEAELDFLF